MPKCNHCGAPLTQSTREPLIKLKCYFDEMRRTIVHDNDPEINEDAKDIQDWVWAELEEELIKEIEKELK